MTFKIDGANGLTFPNNSTQFSAGQILQVVQSRSDSTMVSTSSTSFVSTGLAASITPKSSSSKILVTLNGGGAYMLTSASTTMRITIYRNSTDLSTVGTNNGLARHSSPGGSWTISPYSISFLDSPATTSSTTYTVYFRNGDTAATVQFQSDDRGVPALTLMEVAG